MLYRMSGGHRGEMYFHTAAAESNMLFVAYVLSDLLFYVSLLRFDKDQLNVCYFQALH
jgi:hypothetical protein